MSITITLPDEVVERIQRLAAKSGQDVEDVLNKMPVLLMSVLPEFHATPVETLSDNEVLQIADSQMDIEQSQRQSELLQKQQNDALNQGEQQELDMLLSIYKTGQRRKLEGWVEAVKRGLRVYPGDEPA
jgi:hypothetical protein